MHLCQRFFQSSKHLLNSISGIAFKAFFDSACISSIVSKRFPRRSDPRTWELAASHHRPHQFMASFSLDCHRLVEWGRHNELEASMVGAASSHVLGSLPRSGLLSLGNSEKLHGAKSGEYGGCGKICVEFLAKLSRRTSAVWDGAL